MRLSEVRHGRNFIRSGDLVRVRPSRAEKHDGFLAKFLYADTDKGGMFYALLEYVQIDGRPEPCQYRFVKPDRVKRLATTGAEKQGVRP